jgi:Flp pilus assembly protein TadB
MAQTKRKRKRKHRGTPAGTVERPARSGRPQSREDAKKLAKQKRLERMDREPTWRGAANRAAIAAAVFGVLAVLVLKRNAAQGVTLAVFMFVLYIPLGYATDSALHRYRRRRRD